RNPVGQEEKTGLARFPLAVLSTALHPANTLPCGTAKKYFYIVQGGTGRAGQSTKKEPIPQTKKHTPKRHNRLYQDKTKNCNAHYRIKKDASNLATKQ
ncbi:hypothetical protein, partial [Bacteroides acidifaciens]|uniref:hypothetical protein n=1 Tax=Bacteroides acidifaciens TaxID=85831 RepID=UPI002595E667